MLLLAMCADALAQNRPGDEPATQEVSGQPVQGQPDGPPQPDRTLRDAEFGVRARHLGLERQVTMLQWQRTASGYVQVWSADPIDSTGYSPGHENPPLPLRSRRWLPDAVTIDGKPLDPGVLSRLGEWQDLHPGFSALPGNLAATFQPEGSGLGSAENPLEPQVGDLRIRWRDLVLPPLQGRVVLRGGRWRMPAVEPASRSAVRSEVASDPVSRPVKLLLFGGGAMVVLLGAFALRRRGR